MTKPEMIASLSVLVAVLEKRVERIRVKSDKDEERLGNEDDYKEGFADGVELVIEEVNDIIENAETDENQAKSLGIIADAGMDVLRFGMKELGKDGS